jgi:opacity protein-like surface antigen
MLLTKEKYMKKVLIASVIALAATAASALELGVHATRDYAGSNRNYGGITIGNTYGAMSATAGFERSSVGTNDQNRWSLVGGYDVVTLGTVTVTPKVGVAYLDNQVGSDGYAMTVGVGASMPLTQQVSLTADMARQYGQNRVNQFDGNRVSLGLKYKF